MCLGVPTAGWPCLGCPGGHRGREYGRVGAVPLPLQAHNFQLWLLAQEVPAVPVPSSGSGASPVTRRRGWDGAAAGSGAGPGRGRTGRRLHRKVAGLEVAGWEHIPGAQQSPWHIPEGHGTAQVSTAACEPEPMEPIPSGSDPGVRRLRNPVLMNTNSLCLLASRGGFKAFCGEFKAGFTQLMPAQSRDGSSNRSINCPLSKLPNLFSQPR